MALILAVDDDPEALGSVRRVLLDADHTVLTASDGEEGLRLIEAKQPELVILDVIMPGLNGIEVCKRIRANPFTARLPVLFLTARSRPGDVAEGLDAGGDDYITKPFQVIELPARIRALLRRGPGAPLAPDMDYLTIGTVRLNTRQPVLLVADQPFELTRVEHWLLHYLMLRPGHPRSIDDLLEHIWQYPPGIGDPALVYAHIKNLRRKIEPNPDSPAVLVNVRGKGYMIASP